jgi:hypothetical protein
MEGSCNGLTEVLPSHLPGETDKLHDKSQECRCLCQDADRAPPGYKSTETYLVW